MAKACLKVLMLLAVTFYDKPAYRSLNGAHFA